MSITILEQTYWSGGHFPWNVEKSEQVHSMYDLFYVFPNTQILGPKLCNDKNAWWTTAIETVVYIAYKCKPIFSMECVFRNVLKLV